MTTVRIMRTLRGSPDALLENFKFLYRPSNATYFRVWESALKSTLAEHVGPEDVPCGSEEIMTGRRESPFEINYREYLQHLRDGEPVFEFVLEECAVADEELSHYSVSEAAAAKCTDREAVEKAVQKGILLREFEGIAKNDAFYEWVPSRISDTLRYRMEVMYEIVQKPLPDYSSGFIVTLGEERLRTGARRLGKPLRAYLEEIVGPLPEKEDEWYDLLERWLEADTL